MAISRKDFPVSDYGLSQQVRKRINELVGLQLTPTTINLFTAEWSKMDELIKINIGMYIAQLLEIENSLLQEHFSDLRDRTVHGNSRDHLIMEQRKANLMRIQQIFTQEVQRQERIEEQMTQKSIYEAQAENSLGLMDLKTAMVTNPSDLSLVQLERTHQAQVANIRRNKELYDFEIEQISKLLTRYQQENNIQKVLELQNRIKIVEQEYLLRRDAMLRTIDVHQQKMKEQARKEGTTLKNSRSFVSSPNTTTQTPATLTSKPIKVEKQAQQQEETSIDFDNFFDVDTVEIKAVESGKKPKANTKKTGKNKVSKIPNEVLEDQTVELSEIIVSDDISNPNKTAFEEIDKILEETEELNISTERADKTNDPFLMLLARDRDLKVQQQAEEKRLLEAANATKAIRETIEQKKSTNNKSTNKGKSAKPKSKKPVAKKRQEEDSAITSSLTKKINDISNISFNEEDGVNEKVIYKVKVDNTKVQRQQEMLNLKNEQLKLKEEKNKMLLAEKQELQRQLQALEKQNKLNNKSAYQNNNQQKLNNMQTNNKNVVQNNQPPVGEAAQSVVQNKTINVEQKQVIVNNTISSEQNISTSTVKNDTTNIAVAVPVDNEIIAQIKDENKELQKRLKALEQALEKDNNRFKRNKTSKPPKTQEYIERIKLLEKTNKQLSKTLDSKNDELENQQHKKARNAVTLLKNLYSERLKGINILNYLRNRQKEYYDGFEKRNHIKDEANHALTNLFTKQKAYIAKTDLEKKDKVQEIKHYVLANEDIAGSANKNVSVVDVLIDDMIDKTKDYSDNWAMDDVFDDDLKAIDSKELVIDPSIFEDEVGESQDSLKSPTDRFIQDEIEKSEMLALERKARLNIITSDESVKLQKFQQKFKRDKGLKKYRLLNYVNKEKK